MQFRHHRIELPNVCNKIYDVFVALLSVFNLPMLIKVQLVLTEFTGIIVFFLGFFHLILNEVERVIEVRFKFLVDVCNMSL